MIRGTPPEPGENFWFDEMVKFKSIEINEVDDPKEVFGRPVVDVSQKSDIIRLKALRQFGGVYVDTDIIVLKSFDELMTGSEELVMGVEKADGTLDMPVKINGLCNAVLISKKNSSFLNTWWENYRTFEGQPFRGSTGVWNYHSVILPWELAKNAALNRTPVTVLDHRSFFTPLWDDPGLKWIHGTLNASAVSSDGRHTSSVSNDNPQDPPAPLSIREMKPSRPPSKNLENESRNRRSFIDSNPTSRSYPGDELEEDIEIIQDGTNAPDQPGFRLEATGQFAYHMWHHLLEERISLATDGEITSIDGLDPIDSLTRDSSFNRVARKYLNEDIMKRWYDWKEARST